MCALIRDGDQSEHAGTSRRQVVTVTRTQAASLQCAREQGKEQTIRSAFRMDSHTLKHSNTQETIHERSGVKGEESGTERYQQQRVRGQQHTSETKGRREAGSREQKRACLTCIPDSLILLTGCHCAIVLIACAVLLTTEEDHQSAPQPSSARQEEMRGIWEEQRDR